MAYDGTSAEARLAAVRAAINAILSGAEEYSVGSRRVRRADLGTLFEQESMLMMQVDRASYGIFTVGQVDRPTSEET